MDMYGELHELFDRHSKIIDNLIAWELKYKTAISRALGDANISWKEAVNLPWEEDFQIKQGVVTPDELMWIKEQADLERQENAD